MADFRTVFFAAVALTVDLLFAFVILGSPKKPKGPRGALWRVGWIGNRRQPNCGEFLGTAQTFSLAVMLPLTNKLYRKRFKIKGLISVST
jgi:hypothetical protein